MLFKPKFHRYCMRIPIPFIAKINTNRPTMIIAGKPTAKIFNCGDALATIPRPIFIKSCKSVTAIKYFCCRFSCNDHCWPVCINFRNEWYRFAHAVLMELRLEHHQIDYLRGLGRGKRKRRWRRKNRRTNCT